MVDQALMRKLAQQQLNKQQAYVMPNVLTDCFKEQLDFINDESKRKAVLCSRRCLSANSLILTSNGIKPIKDIEIGEYVYSELGQPIKVLNKFKNGIKEVFPLTRSNIEYFASTKDHIWLTCEQPNKTYKGFSNKEKSLESFSCRTKIMRRFVQIPFGDINEPHAYVLGAMLGDGCCLQGANQLYISSEDRFIPEKCAEILGCNTKRQHKGNFTWSLTSKNDNSRKGDLSQKIICNHYDRFCKDKKAHEKFIDLELLKTWNRKSILAFIAGILDTDGSIYIGNDNCLNLRIRMQSKSIIDALEYLFRSLWQCVPQRSIDNREKYINGPLYYIAVKSNLFVKIILKELSSYLVLERKKYKPEYDQTPERNDVEGYAGFKVGSSRFEETYDLEVDSESHLYLTANGFITHNSGKTSSAALYLLQEGLKYPGSKLIYIGLTNSTAKTVIWKDILEPIFIKHKIKYEFLETKLEIRFNKSVIFLAGCDATPKQMNKLRGNKYRLCIVDEAQSWQQDLRALTTSVLAMTLAETNSTLCIMGTCGNQMGNHYWYQINKPESKEKEWKKFSWSWKNNPHVRDKIQKEIDQMIENNPLIVQTSSFRQEVLNEWVVEVDARVYKSTDQNYISSLPLDLLKNTTYILSCDFGFEDATAFVVSCYNRSFNNKMYVLESSKYQHLTITDAVAKIREYQKRYDFRMIVGDSAAKQCVEEIRQVHGIYIEPADKMGKFAHITMLNSDFITKNVLILEQTNKELIKELDELIWDPRALQEGRHKEKDSLPNHITDSLLYGFFASRHYWYEPAVIINPNAEDVIRQNLLDQHKKLLGNQENKLDVNYELNMEIDYGY
jgi:hypothetical protein